MDDLTFQELQAMEMIYRRQVEFAVGHGVGVHTETPPGVSDRASRIRTRAVPSY